MSNETHVHIHFHVVDVKSLKRRLKRMEATLQEVKDAIAEATASIATAISTETEQVLTEIQKLQQKGGATPAELGGLVESIRGLRDNAVTSVGNIITPTDPTPTPPPTA